MITDKDMVEWNVLKSELTQIHLQKCLYHVITFSHEVSVEKLGITSGEKQTVLQLLQKIAYAKSTDDYEMQYNHNLASSLLEHQLDLNLIKPFFTAEAWVAVQSVIEERKKLPRLCCQCGRDISEKQSIGCDSCMEWVHLECTSLKKVLRTKFWYCTSCK